MSKEEKPDYVNPEGVKWFKDTNVTEYAQIKGLRAVCFKVEQPDGYKTRVLIGENKEVLAATHSLEEMGLKIDMLAFIRTTTT